MWPFWRRPLPPGPNQLRLRDLTFEIDSTSLGAGLADPHWAAKYDPKNRHPLHWGLTVECKPLDVDGETWGPSVSHETMTPQLNRWTDWAGQTIKWSRPFDPVTGSPNGGFYVFEHGNIRRACLEFLDRFGKDFNVRWSGACDINWSWKYGTSVPFSLLAVASINEIIVHGSELDTDESIRQRLAQYVSLDGLKQKSLELTGHRYQDGVAMASAIFEPCE